MTQLPNFNAIYQGQPVTPAATRVPWNIGEPQPAIAALIAGGQVSSPVLDAGCGIATIIDSTLFHSLALEQRDGYLRAITQAARPGATLHMLVFDRRAPLRPGSGPQAVDETELREAISPHWTIDAITPSSIHAWTPEGFAAPIDRDAQGRALFPAFLLRAHLPSDHIPQGREPIPAHPGKITRRP